MKKDKQFSIRISEQDLETIRRKAAQAHMSQSDYVTACCLGKRIMILNGLTEVLQQQKAIGKLKIRLSRPRLYRLPRISQKRFDRRAAEKRRYAPHCRAGQEQPCTGGRSHCI